MGMVKLPLFVEDMYSFEYIYHIFFTNDIYTTMYGTALFIVVVIIIIYAITCSSDQKDGGFNPMEKGVDMVKSLLFKVGLRDTDPTKDPFSNEHISKNNTPAAMDHLSSLEGFDVNLNSHDDISGHVSSYDPIAMGAVKKSEVDAHHKNLKERSSFSTVGTAAPSSVRRDDDPFIRESGVPWVGGVPSRAFKAKSSGPQDGARQLNSTSANSIKELTRKSNEMRCWNS
jgi:hypothetical protein